MRSEYSIILAHNLKRLREAHGYTLRELAGLVGNSHGTVHRYELMNSRWCPPTFGMLERLAALYQVSIPDLFSKGGSAARQQAVKGYTIEDSVLVINKHLKEAGLEIRRVPAALRA